MPDLEGREHLAGVARTLSVLADGLVRDGFINPGEDPSTESVLKELAGDLEETIDSRDVKRLPLLLLQVVRAASLACVSPMNPPSGEGGGVSVDTADIAGGLELLQQAPSGVNLELRGIAVAMSVLFDYAYVVAKPMIEQAVGELDVVTITRGALAVAEVSIRTAMDEETRGTASIAVLRQCANMIARDIEERKEEKVGTADGE